MAIRTTFIQPEQALVNKRTGGSRNGERMDEYEQLAQSVVDNSPQVLVIEPDATKDEAGNETGDTARAIRLRIAQARTRLANKEGSNVDAGRFRAWTDANGNVNVQYVRENDDTVAPKDTDAEAAEAETAAAEAEAPKRSRRGLAQTGEGGGEQAAS